MAEDKPTAAFVLSLVGGIFVVLGGLLLAAIGAFLSFFIGGVGGVIGLIGVVIGIIMIVGAWLAYANPASKTLWGVLIIVLSIISWIVALGGFFLGFILGLIGGILFIVWKPTGAAAGGGRVCLGCGRQIPLEYYACPYCGRPVTQAAPAPAPMYQAPPQPAYQAPYQAPPGPQRFCQNCGSPIPQGAAACPRCGRPA